MHEGVGLRLSAIQILFGTPFYPVLECLGRVQAPFLILDFLLCTPWDPGVMAQEHDESYMLCGIPKWSFRLLTIACYIPSWESWDNGNLNQQMKDIALSTPSLSPSLLAVPSLPLTRGKSIIPYSWHFKILKKFAIN